MLCKVALISVNGTQAVTLPEAVAFAPSVREVAIVRDGNQLIITPVGSSWDDFFDEPGVSLERAQPAL